jgi:hypothetical protein
VRRCREHCFSTPVGVGRYYDPTTGQFLSVDPLVDETGEPYVYTGGDPVNGSDPSGLCVSFFNVVCVEGGSVTSTVSLRFNPMAGLNWFNENVNPAYLALTGYYNEAQAAENGCGFWTEAKYGAEGVLGLVGTGAIAVGGAGAVGGLVGGIAEESADPITGFTQHGLEQALGRDGVGVSDSAMADAVANPEEVIPQSGGAVKYVGRDAVVVLNSDGKVITTWATSSAGTR